MSNSLWSHGLQHTRLPWPPLSPSVCSNSWLLHWRCHPAISFSVVPFSACLQCSPASGSFLMSQLSPSGGQSIGASASASVLPMNIHSWFPLGLTCLISLLSKVAQKSSPSPQFESISFLMLRLLYGPTLTYRSTSLYRTTGKTRALTIRTLVHKMVSLLFNMLSSIIIAFLPKSRFLLISWLQSPSTVILEP